jgi:hypothetical protein
VAKREGQPLWRVLAQRFNAGAALARVPVYASGGHYSDRDLADELKAYRARGYKGLVSYVEADNLNSLKSTHRMSYIDFGRVLLWRVGKRHLILRTPGCATFGFRVESIRTNSGPVP